jgi:hypothetical protein
VARRIAVIGNSQINIGAGVAADLALAGHDVAFFNWPESREIIDEINAQGGIEVRGDPNELVSGRLGLAKPRLATTDIAAALSDAELVIVDVPWLDLERRFAQMLPSLVNGQVVHINMHGYWGAFRVAPMLRAAGKEGVTITEGPDPTMAAIYAKGIVTPNRLKRMVPVAAFPATRNQSALALLKSVYPTIVEAPNVLHTNLESMNLMVHPAMTLLNIGAFDKSGDEGRPIRFYVDGNSHHASVLSEALDRERGRVCQAYGVRFKPFPAQMNDLYSSSGSTFRDGVATSAWLRDYPPLPNNVWETWMRADAPLLHAPLVALAENAGLSAPLFRGIVDILGAVLEEDFWSQSLTLDRMGLAGLAPERIVQYAQDGKLQRRSTP